MKKLSKRRSSQNKEYLKLRKEFLERPENKWCPVCLRGLNGVQSVTRATEIHHINGREGIALCDEKNWVALSTIGHRWVHANPKQAMKHGLMKKSVSYIYEELKKQNKE